jgi:hypothetical protein
MYYYRPLGVCIADTDKSNAIISFVLSAVTVSGVTTFTQTSYASKDCTGTATSAGNIAGISVSSGCSIFSSASSGYFSQTLTTTSAPPSGFSGVHSSSYNTQAGCAKSATSALVSVGGSTLACIPYVVQSSSTPSISTYHTAFSVSPLGCKADSSKSGTGSWKANAMSTTVGILIAAVTCLLIV